MAGRNKDNSWGGPRDAARPSLDPDYLFELAMDKHHDDNRWYRESLAQGYHLADFECKHDRLPGDQSLPCGCWPEEETSMADELMGVIKRMAQLNLPAHAKTEHKTLYSCGTVECKTVMFTATVEDDGRCPGCDEPGSVLRGPIRAAK